ARPFARFERHRCRRVVLVATAPGSLMVPARPSVLARMVTPRRYLDRGYLRENAADLYGGSARGQPERISALMHANSRVGPALGYVYQLASGAGWTSLPFLPLIRQPTLIVSGDDDPLIPLANARLMHSLIPRSRLHVYHGGHLALVTEAAELAPVVGRFLAADLPDDGGRAASTGKRGAAAPLSRGGPDAQGRRCRLLPARAAARRRRPRRRGAHPGVHDQGGRAGHQPVLDPGGVPARADPRLRPARHHRRRVHRLRLPRRRPAA